MESSTKNISLTTRPKWEIVLRALKTGVPVYVGHYDYKLVKAGDPITTPSGVYESDHDVLCYMMSGAETYTLPADIPMNSFFEMCETLTEEDCIHIIASSVLKEKKR